MTTDEFIQALDRLGMTENEFAAYIRVTERAVQYWRSGQRAIPAWMPRMIELMTERYPDDGAVKWWR